MPGRMLAHMDLAPMRLAAMDQDELDAGPRKAAPGAERFCAATGTVRPVADMIRFVVAPDGQAVADLKRRLPGRGIWITATRQALRTAIARKVFGRGFKRDVRLAPDMIEATERLMEQSALAALAIAHKAGKVAIGARKLDAALRRLDPDAGKIAVIDTFTSVQLDLALGRSNVIHAALLAGRESDTFMARAGLLDRFRTGDLGDRNELKPATNTEKQDGNG
jgi:uncharacterized protein